MKIANGEFWLGDCLDLMKNIPDGSVDFILCDLPYGTTQNRWDTVIPFEPLWEHYWRVSKPNAAVVLFAAQPFTTTLISSQLKYFKYDWTWDKVNPTGFGNAKKQPLRNKEDICVFYRSQCTYNPQMVRGKPNHKQGSSTIIGTDNYNKGFKRTDDDLSGMKYPKQVIQFPKHSSQGGLHPTQKPIALFEYLIETYTNKGQVVLDNTAGSGTTAIAAENTGRKWICIEQDETYYKIATDRVKEHTEEQNIKV